MMLSISIDIDWAPDRLIEEARTLLDNAGIRATFFATHHHGVDLGNHEIGLHPNFVESLPRGTGLFDIIGSIRRIFPNAKGVRGHSLCNSTRFYPFYREFGLEYESSHLCYAQHELLPYWMIERIVQLPLFFEDDLHMELADQWGHRRFSLEDLEVNRGGLKIFNFHPVHLWLNTEHLDRYWRAKHLYHDPDGLATHRNISARGTRDLFLDLLSYIQRTGTPTATVGEIAAAWRQKQEAS